MSHSKVTLDQWQVFVAVIDSDGFAQAAEQLGRSQSAISYAMSKLQEHLGTNVMQLQGRKAFLTPSGDALLRHARYLIRNANRIEFLGDTLENGGEVQVRLSVDTAFPTPVIHRVLKQFSEEFPEIEVHVHNAVMSGGEEALDNKRADLVISPWVPNGFLGTRLMSFNMIAVSSAEHPLQRQKRALTIDDLFSERQVVVRDSGIKAKRDMGWLGATSRWTVDSMADSLALLRDGIGYAWLPEYYIKDDLETGRLQPLPLLEGGIRHGELHLIWLDREVAGPGCQRLAELISEAAATLEAL